MWVKKIEFRSDGINIRKIKLPFPPGSRRRISERRENPERNINFRFSLMQAADLEKNKGEDGPC